jgi:phage terminase large subunit
MRIEIQTIDEFGNFFLENENSEILLLYGGAGSGKSYSTAIWLLEKALKERNKRFLITRKTLPSLKVSCLQLFRELLSKYNLSYEFNKSELEMVINTNQILFKSLDNADKIKSAEFNYIWAEEATELTHQDYLQLRLRLRRKNDLNNQIITTFNPIDQFHWLKTKVLDREKVSSFQSNYKMNPFLSREYIEQLEGLAEVDENYYRIYALGEWGVLKNLIYSNWDTVTVLPEDYDEIIYGLDFGYINPTVLVEIRLKENEAWVQELIYQSRLTNSDLIELLKMKVDKNAQIYADSSEPQRIDEIYKAGFNIYPANKDIKFGINKVKEYKLHILEDSTNTIKEIRSYKWREDKEGRILEEPVKFNDHAMDAMRYALASLRKVSQPVIVADVEPDWGIF